MKKTIKILKMYLNLNKIRLYFRLFCSLKYMRMIFQNAVPATENTLCIVQVQVV